MALSPGQRVGPYEVVSAIGAGGMGEVYRARDTKLNRNVAIKILPAAFAQDTERLARFTREAQTLAALNHPHIAHIHGLEESGDVRALVMELVEGEDLTAYIARGPMPLADALPIARQIADALEAAHEQGIIHRDLKPANVKVRDDGTVKVLDFGLAKALSPETSGSTGGNLSSPTITSPAMTAMGIILGTAAYMSPEQAKGRPVDRRADIWAFGVVLHEMLTGRRLFDAEDMSETLAAVLTRDVSQSSLPPSIPPRLRALIADCLVRDPKQRLRDIGDARLIIDRLMAGEPDIALTPSATAVAPMWRRALPWVAAVVATIGVGIGAWVSAWRLKPEPARTVTRFSLTLPEGQTFANGGRQLVAMSPDGTKLVYVAGQRLFLHEMSGLESHPIPGSESTGGPPIGPAISPDGQSVAFFTEATGGAGGAIGSLKRLAIAGGTAVTICPATNPLGLSWDDSGIMFGQAGKGILRVAADGGEPDVIAAAGTDEVFAKPRMLPGARAVMFSVKKVNETWDQGVVVVQTLLDGARKTVVQGGADGQYLPTGHLTYAVSGVLLSVPFDLGRLAVTGGPVPLIEGIRRTGTTGTAGTGGAQLSYSSTGTLAFVPGPAQLGASNDNAGLAIFDRKGNARPLGLPPGNYRSPRVSPDGKSVAFETEDARGTVVWIYELAGGTAIRRLTFDGRNQDPIWSSDGQWVAFQSDREGDRGIFRQRADGSGVAERLTRAEAGRFHVPHAFSPDGAFLLYGVRTASGRADPGQQRGPILWTLSMKDRKATAFGVEQSTSAVEGVFSPDGHWVAYHNREASTGPAQTYLQPFPPTGAKYLVGTGGQPYWSPKGDQLILNVNAGISVIIPVKTTPAVTFGKPIDFPRTGRMERNPTNFRRNADSLPDGEHIIGVTIGPTAIAETAAYTPEIVVVLNWFDEVRRKVR